MVHTELHKSFLSGGRLGLSWGGMHSCGQAVHGSLQEAVAQRDAGMVPTEHEQTLLFFCCGNEGAIEKING